MKNGKQDEQMTKDSSRFRFRFIIGAVAILGIILLTASALLIYGGIQTQKYNSFIKTGNQYYSAENYEQAVAAYRKALEIDDGKESAYMNLSVAYAAMGDYSSALTILEQGMQKTDSKLLLERYDAVKKLRDDSQDAASRLSQEEIETFSEKVAVENSVFDMVAAYTYTDYYRDWAEPASNTKSGKTVMLYYDDLDGYADYYDIDQEKVLNASGNMPIATAKPCSVRFTKISRLLGSSQEIYVVSKKKLVELFGDEASFYQDEESGRYYMSVDYKGCRFTVETNEEGNILSEFAWNELKPLNRGTLSDEENKKKGRVSGYVQDAMTGKGMKADLKLRNYGQKNGTALESFTSGVDGSYTYEGTPGRYTMEISAQGYVTEYLDFEIIEGQTRTGQNMVLSPEVGEGEIRIVLTWGANPTDLDSHTDGYSTNGTAFSINYIQQTVEGVGMLDVDDMNGYGPETTTITDTGAEFTFKVVDFTRSGMAGASGATVKVYLPGSEQPTVYTLPSEGGNVWNVFRYANGTITPVNTVE